MESYSLKASNLFGSGILFREADSKTISYLTDGHGDVVGLSDEFGKVTSRKEYEPFGKERQPEATGFGKGILTELQREEADGADNPFGYCGEYLDEETGFIYLRARYYSPDTGRFVSEDPIRDGLNWYGYCANNPVRYTDPYGLWMAGDEKLSGAAQTYTIRYGEKWNAAKETFDVARSNGDLTGAAAAQAEMDWLHAKAEDIRLQDKHGGIQGKILDVPTYSQKNTAPNTDKNKLCWATATAMVVSFHLGDSADRTYELAEQFAEPDYTNYNVGNSRPRLNTLGYEININESYERRTLTISEIKNAIDSDQPFTMYYEGSSSGHFVVGVGYAAAEGHETMIVYNDPWDGAQKNTHLY